MNSLSKLFEILHLSRGEMALRKSHRRRRARRQGSALSCETLEPKQLLAADVAVQFSDIVLDTTDPVTVALEGTFEDTAVSGTVVKFETNAPLTDNDFYVELTSNTPLTNANFLSYVNSGAYDNSKFHRSVSDFVLQGGGFKHPTVSADQPGSDPVAIPTTGTVQNEPGNLNTRGTIAMAKLGGQPDSATSQFFFNLSENSFLDSDNGGYTAFGDVLGSGMTVVDTMGSALTYDAQTYYSNTALSDLPLWNINQDNIVQPQDFVKIENADVVTESALMTYTVTSSDTAKLVASFDSNGDLVLTPVGGATGSVDVTVTAASRLDSSSDSDTFSVQLNSPAGPTITPIESLGSTVLGKDATGKLYADVQAISYGGQHLTETQFATFTPRAVEDFGSNGGKQMLFEKIDGSYSLWSMTSSWAYQSNIIVGAGDTSAINAALVKFGLADPAPVLTPIESAGNTVLNQDQNGNLYAGETAIEYNGNQLNFQEWVNKGYTAVSADSVNGNNRLVWKIGDVLYQFVYAGSSWTTVTGGVAGGAPSSARYYATEIEQGVDFDNDTIVGPPITITAIESLGDTVLNQDQNGNLYAGETAIEYNGNQLNFQEWVNKGYTAVSADSVNGNNRLVWKIGDVLYQFVYAGSSWTTVTGGVAGGAPDSDLYYATEEEQGLDFDGDTIAGTPFDEIETSGDVVLKKHKSTGIMYAGNNALEYNGNALTYQGWVSKGYTAVAADMVDDKYVLVWKIGTALYQWEYDSSWTTVVTGFGSRAAGTDAYFNTEQQFGVDFDGDTIAGTPFDEIETSGDVVLKKHKSTGIMYAGNNALEYNGNALTYQGWVSKGYTAVAADMVDDKYVLVWKIGTALYQWEYDSSWTTVVTGFGSRAAGTDAYFNTEQQFGVDFDDDTIVGSPIIEAAGSTTLSLGQNGNLYAGETAIEYNGNQLNFQTWVNKGYTAVAADTVNGNNRLVWKIGDLLYQFEYAGSSWTTVTRGVAGGAPSSARYYATEIEQGLDFDDDAIVGPPTVVIEDFGNVSLTRNGSGILFAGENQLEFNGTPLNYNLWVNRGWTAMAADDNVEGKNVLVWKIGDVLYKFEYDSTWTTVVKGYGSQAPGTAGFYEAEVGYGVNFDGLNGIGN